MSDRDSARHRAPQRPVTVLSDAGDALTGRIAVVGRSGAVLAASTGLIATVGMPTQAYGADVSSSPVSATSAVARPSFSVVPSELRSHRSERSSRGSLTAPMAATVTFESSSFTAQPAPARPAVPTARTNRRASENETTANGATESGTASSRRTVTRVKPASSRSEAVAAEKAAQKKAAHKKAAEKALDTKAAQKAADDKAADDNAVAKKAAYKKALAHKTPTKKRIAPPKHSRPVDPPAKKRPTKPRPPAAKPKPKPKPAPQPSRAARGSAVLAVAARYVGTPYVYGGSTPRGFDCSGYTSYVFRQLGFSLPRTANQQMHATHRISRAHARAGDLVFFVSGGRAYHVGIYAGHGKMYDAPHTGKRVSKRAIWSAAVVYGRVTR